MIIKQLAELNKKMEKNQAAAIYTQPSSQGELEMEEGVNCEEVNYLGNSSRQANDPYSKTYNSDWRNHPNFGWGNQQNQGQDHRTYNPNQYNNSTHQNSNQKPSNTIQNTHSHTTYQSHNNHSQHPNFNEPSPQDDDRMARMEAMLASLCKEVEDIKKFKEEQIFKSTDSFPSDTEKNPREEMKKVRWEECKAVTLANEKIMEEDTGKLTEHHQESSESNMKRKEQGTRSVQGKDSTREETLKPYNPKAPFPQRLKADERERSYSKFLDMFASLSVNIPYLDILKQMSACIKWMKELLAKKSNLKGGQTVVMNKECSALIQKDKLHINEVKSTDVIIQLVDKTQKHADGIVENVLVKVGNYFLPIDFVILDMEESYFHPVILGRPFLVTGWALINVEQGELILRIHDE
ncbi:uncharacterized protein LOC107493637 [Arachis duranensis]|uniref:Uncharacterized protein LOC107493637 n=1 Tax=Arachis duranensis TaxID=130453 RepID=A0A6P4DW90_ARADU|nr:uncharacterized protein LOC107493637 [Arachis duranensis]